ncbi:MAG TPA: ABC transporter permease [Bacteroidales bacterium]
MKASEFELIIEPGRTEKNYWTDLWRYRELFYILSWRDLKVRYKQTVVGVAWSVVRPLLTMIIFTLVFGRLAKMHSIGDAPYPIMVFAGLLPWYFFSNSLSEASNSLIGNTNLISKVYFPRLIIPASSIITSFVDFLISFVLMLILMVYYQFVPSWHMIFMPLFLIVAFGASFGFGLWLTTMNVKYRDFRYIIPFIVQFGLYISPVGFSSSIVPEKWRLLYSLNPMVGVIDGFRWSIIGDAATIYWPGFLASLGVIVFLMWYSIRHFRKMEKAFADYI